MAASLDYNMSVAVWVGLIALLGVVAQTGVLMLLYLDQEHRFRIDGAASFAIRKLWRRPDRLRGGRHE